MRRHVFVASFALTWLIGVAAYVLYHYPSSILRDSEPRIECPQEIVLQAPSASPQDSLAAPLPPQPTPDTGQVFQVSSEQPRALIGETSEQLKQLELSLPEGAQVYTQPEGQTHIRAVILMAKLNGDGDSETVVVYREYLPTAQEPTPRLSLAILTRKGERQVLQSTVPLVGGVLFNIDINGTRVPLAIRDVTGDGRLEIIVASGVGASLGGQLQIFDFDGRSFRRIGNIGGHRFSVVNGGTGRSSVIKARWRNDDKALVYSWNNKEFTSAE